LKHIRLHNVPSGDFSYNISAIEPDADADVTVTITPTYTTTTYKYSLEATRTDGSGTITYESFLTSGTSMSFGNTSFTDEDSFTLSFSTSEDTYDVSVTVQ